MAGASTRRYLFRGTFRLNIPRKSITKLDAANGTLRVTFPEGTATFELGATAVRWAARIKNPPSLLDKLGVKPGMRVAGGAHERQRGDVHGH